MISDRVEMASLIAPVFRKAWHKVERHECSEMWAYGGRGSGKSTFISLAIVKGLLQEPDANAIIYRKVGETLRESVYAQMAWAIAALHMDRYFLFKVSPMEIVYLPTGQRILFKGADKPEKSKSLKLQKGYFKYLWFEELPEFTDLVEIATIKASVLRGGNKPSVTFFSYNPPMSFSNWVNEEVLKEHKGRFVHKSCFLDLPKEWLGEAFLAEAEAMRLSNDLLYRHMYLGEITGAGEQVFSEFVNAPEKGKQSTHVIEPFDPPKTWKILRSYDWGYNKPYSCGWFAVDHDGVMYQILEDYGSDGTPNKGVRKNEHDVFASIAEVERTHPWLAGKQILGVADPSIWDGSRGPSIADTAGKYGVYFEPADNKRIPGWMQLHYRLRFDDDGYPMLYFFKGCKHSIRTLPMMIYDEHKPEDVDTEMEDHAPDMIRYACMRNPINPPQAEPKPIRLPGPLDREQPRDDFAFFRVRV